MPFNGFTQAAYAQKMIDEYKAAGVPPERVFPQSFDKNDVLYWVEHEPAFGRQAVYLDDAETPRRTCPASRSWSATSRPGINIVGAADVRAAGARRAATASCHRTYANDARPPASTSSPGRWSARACSPTANNGFYYQTFDRPSPAKAI